MNRLHCTVMVALHNARSIDQTVGRHGSGQVLNARIARVIAGIELVRSRRARIRVERHECRECWRDGLVKNIGEKRWCVRMLVEAGRRENCFSFSGELLSVECRWR
jgi:hypothetical protein